MVQIEQNMQEKIRKARNDLLEDEVVVFPSETVYGIGANALSDKAVQKIYDVKKRPANNPLIMHFGEYGQSKDYVVWSDLAEKIAYRFWPGPLTMILPAKQPSKISPIATTGLKTLGVRIPSHPLAQALLKELPFPVAAPSANFSGLVSPTKYEHVKQFENLVASVIDGGDCGIGVESTIVDLSQETPVVLRPGTITIEQLREFCPDIHIDETVRKKLTAPGQMKTHYSPNTPVILNATEVNSSQALLAFGSDIPTGAKKIMNLSEKGDLSEAAQNLYAMLRELDVQDCSEILVMPIPQDGIGIAINNRLQRAAAKK